MVLPIKLQELKRKGGVIMFCGKCGSSVKDGLSFCPNCGAPVNEVPEQQSISQTVGLDSQTPVVQQPIVLTHSAEIKENGFAIAGLIISLFSLISISFNYVNILVPLTALIFSIIGVSRKNSKRKGFAIMGIIIASFFLIGGLCATCASA